MGPQQTAKTSVDLFSLPITSGAQERQGKAKAPAKRESLKSEATTSRPARNPSGFSNFSNLKASPNGKSLNKEINEKEEEKEEERGDRTVLHHHEEAEGPRDL